MEGNLRSLAFLLGKEEGTANKTFSRMRDAVGVSLAVGQAKEIAEINC
jgi:hypothetical protein